jgi:hypothetical protein
MDGRFQTAFELLANAVKTEPTNTRNVLTLQEMMALFPYVSNTSPFESACESILSSPDSPRFAKYKAREAMMDYHVQFGRMRDARALAREQGILTNWNILGPAELAGRADLTFPFLFESSFDESATYPDFGERNGFQKLPPFTSIGEFAPFYGRNSRYAICYLTTKAAVKTSGTYLLHLQISDPFKLWINGKLVIENGNSYSHYTPDKLVQLDLPAGTINMTLKMQRLNSLPIFRIAFLDAQWSKVEPAVTGAVQAKDFKFNILQTPDRMEALQKLGKGNISSEELLFLARKDFFDGEMDSYIKLMQRLISQEPKNKFLKYSYANSILATDDFPGSARINKALAYLKEISDSRHAGPTCLLIRNDIRNSRLQEAAERIRNLTSYHLNSLFSLIVKF